MANSDKNIVITPNVGSSTNDPTIVFSGANTAVGPQSISLKAYPTLGGTLSFEGSSGQLFSINNTLTGYVYSVNDPSGVPLIDAHANGSVRINPIYGNTIVGQSALFLRDNTTSGTAEYIPELVFRLAANGTAFGPTVGNFFGTNSSANLEASSVYEVNAYCAFTKTTAGTATWALVASSAPTRMIGTYLASPITGIAAGAVTSGFAGAQAATSAAFSATGSLSTAVNHAFQFKFQVQTNLATNIRLQLTQSLGTATPLAGSYYTVRKIPASVGTFVA